MALSPAVERALAQSWWKRLSEAQQLAHQHRGQLPTSRPLNPADDHELDLLVELYRLR